MCTPISCRCIGNFHLTYARPQPHCQARATEFAPSRANTLYMNLPPVRLRMKQLGDTGCQRQLTLIIMQMGSNKIHEQCCPVPQPRNTDCVAAPGCQVRGRGRGARVSSRRPPKTVRVIIVQRASSSPLDGCGMSFSQNARKCTDVCRLQSEPNKHNLKTRTPNEKTSLLQHATDGSRDGGLKRGQKKPRFPPGRMAETAQTTKSKGARYLYREAVRVGNVTGSRRVRWVCRVYRVCPGQHPPPRRCVPSAATRGG